MIHLFKKIYIETDQKLDVDENRIVISETTGYPVSSNFQEAFAGKLYFCANNFESFLKDFGADQIAKENDPEEQMEKYGKIELKGPSQTFQNFYEFLNFVDVCYEETKEPLYIHLDQKAFDFFMIHWYKILFPNITFESFSALLKSYILFNKAFSLSPNSKMRRAEFDLFFNELNLQKLFEELEVDEEKSKNFVDQNKKDLSLEFLLANYQYDGSCSKEIIKPVSSLLKKIVEDELYETKERVYIHLNSKNLLTQINLNDTYNFYNIDKIIENDNVLSIFFDRNIWKKTNSVIEGSSSGTINFININDENIEKICRIRAIMEMSETEFNTFGFSGYFKTTKDIFSCIKYFREKDLLTEEELEEVLKNDIKNVKSFFHTLMVPINFYFLDHVIKSKNDNNLENLEKFVLR